MKIDKDEKSKRKRQNLGAHMCREGRSKYRELRECVYFVVRSFIRGGKNPRGIREASGGRSEKIEDR